MISLGRTVASEEIVVERPYLALVVDDNAASAGMLAASLRKGGYDVLTASDGHEAIELTSQRRPDVVLLDMRLPGRDGLEVCQTLKSVEATASIPIIFVTAVSEADVMLAAFEAGGADYVTKPFRTAEVLARVSVHAKLHRAETALREKKQQTEQRAQELTEANVHLASLSRSDPLTDLLNRRAWEEAATKEHDRFERHGTTYCMLVIDVDQFKNFNDSLGHQSGDDCLRRVAQAIASTCRSLDQVGRYGGEEFAVLAPETGIEAGFRLAERIRKAIWALAIIHPTSSVAERITASTGVASAAPGPWADALKRADDAMYVAKRAGRNMVYADHSSRRLEDVSSHRDQTPDASIHPPTPQETRPSVLIVDDVADDRALLRHGLEREDFAVREADNGRDAIAIVADDPPDAIIMDVMMPEMDGLECTRQLRNDPDARDIPILMLSACDEGQEIVSGLEVGADEYLTKPVRMDEFLLRVRSMARLHRERSHLLHSYEFRGEKTRILGCLLDFSRVVGASQNLQEVLKATLHVTAEVTSSSRVSIMLPDAERKAMRIVQSIGIDENTARSVRVPLGEMISGSVFTSRRAVVINHQSEARLQRHPYDSPFFAGVPLASIPIGASGETIGVLNVTDRFGRRPFEMQHTEAIDLIAGIAGAAIHRLAGRRNHDQACGTALVALARLAERRTFDIGRHLERVARYCVILAAELRHDDGFAGHIDDTFLHDLQRAVPLHDIGKLGLPDEILLKAGRLTADERTVMQSHALVGAESIRSADSSGQHGEFLEMAAVIAETHHEWYDGGGYPRGLKGNDIPLSGRIAAIADVYDALTTSRVYRDAVTPDRAVTMITELSGTQFDPSIVEALLRCQGEFEAVGTELSDPAASEVDAPQAVTSPR